MTNSQVASVLSEPPLDPGPQAQDHAQPPASGMVCSGCNAHIPIRPAAWMELPSLWRCTTCGAHHCGILPPEARDAKLTGIVLAAQYFACQPPRLEHRSVDGLIDQLHQHELHATLAHRRTSPRLARFLHAQLVAVEDNWTPRGRSFPAIVYNISCGGLAYVTTHVSRAPLVGVQVDTGRVLQIIAQPLWVRPQYDELFTVGIKFLCRLGAAGV